MPNGGPTPDCIHCKHFQGDVKNPRCVYHSSNLPYPIRAFCNAYVDPEPNDAGDWLDQKLNRNELDETMMYLWLDFEVTGKRGRNNSIFTHYPFEKIEVYKSWDSEAFLSEMVKLADKLRKEKN